MKGKYETEIEFEQRVKSKLLFLVGKRDKAVDCEAHPMIIKRIQDNMNNLMNSLKDHIKNKMGL